MGCASSSNKSNISCDVEECFENRLWISRPKSDCEVNPTPPTNDLASPSNLPANPRTPDALSICDDFQEGCEEDRSCGYYSESISTANTSDLSFNANDCDLKMEMYMMTKISKVMPKTSSPILPPKFPSRRDGSEDEQPEEQPKRSYNRWKQYLQRTPPYVLNNVTRIPEAIAGQFSPEGFPGYTDVKRCQRGNVPRRPARIPQRY